MSGAHFDRWWRTRAARDPELLTYTRELLVAPARGGARRARAGRTTWRQGELRRCALTYRFEPGTEHDGVTVHVPLARSPQLRADGLRLARAGAARASSSPR